MSIAINVIAQAIARAMGTGWGAMLNVERFAVIEVAEHVEEALTMAGVPVADLIEGEVYVDLPGLKPRWPLNTLDPKQWTTARDELAMALTTIQRTLRHIERPDHLDLVEIGNQMMRAFECLQPGGPHDK